MHHHRLPRRHQDGLTLIEIMMVVVIIGILVAVIVPNVIGVDDDARMIAQKAEIRSIGMQLDRYRLNNGAYPSTEQGLEALVSEPSGFPEPRNWSGPYLRRFPEDQWGNEYVYVGDGAGFTLKSLGADGAEGGEGANADIGFDDQ